MKDQQPYHKNIVLLLQLATSLVLIGRGWEHFVGDPAYHAFFWNHTLFGWFIEGILGIEWNDFLTNTVYDDRLLIVQHTVGGILLVLALVIWIPTKNQSITTKSLASATSLLLILSLFKTIDHFRTIGQFIEQLSQIACPAILLLFLTQRIQLSNIQFIIKIIIGLTFIGHGLYAIGYYAQPPVFIKMIRSTIACDYATAQIILYIIGALDIIAALLLFVPNKRIQQIALVHIIAWGFITAFGRFFGNVNYNHFWFTAQQFWHLSAFRMVHGILPLVLSLLMKPLLKGFLERPSHRSMQITLKGPKTQLKTIPLIKTKS